jgi:hypothetical protein
MNLYTVSVMLAGDRNHVITGKGPVSVAEIAVLKAIHGETSVYDIRLYRHAEDAEPLPELSLAETRDQLRGRYQNALPAGNEPIVDKLFGPMGALPTTLADIGIDAAAEARKLREQAKAAEAAAAQLDSQAETALSPEEEAELNAFLGEAEAPVETAARKQKAA